MAMTMKKTLKAVFFLATTTAMVIALSNLNNNYQKQTGVEKPQDGNEVNEPVLLASERVNRLLAGSDNHHHYHHRGRSLRPADHCRKDYEVCYLEYGVNSTCCGNKCFDLNEDKKHCGACHNKCKYTYSCCRGKCVDLAYDKRHCGSCNNKCLRGQYCIYGMCDYA